MNRLLMVGLGCFAAVVGLALADGSIKRASAQSGCFGYGACYGCHGGYGCAGCGGQVAYVSCHAVCCGGTYQWNYPVRRFLHHVFAPPCSSYGACGGCYGVVGCYGTCYGGCYGRAACGGCRGDCGCSGGYYSATGADYGDAAPPFEGYTKANYVIAEEIVDEDSSEREELASRPQPRNASQGE